MNIGAYHAPVCETQVIASVWPERTHSAVRTSPQTRPGVVNTRIVISLEPTEAVAQDMNRIAQTIECNSSPFTADNMGAVGRGGAGKNTVSVAVHRVDGCASVQVPNFERLWEKKEREGRSDSYISKTSTPKISLFKLTVGGSGYGASVVNKGNVVHRAGMSIQRNHVTLPLQIPDDAAMTQKSAQQFCSNYRDAHTTAHLPRPILPACCRC